MYSKDDNLLSKPSSTQIEGEELVLGAEYNRAETKFSVWSPQAENIELILYKEQFAKAGIGQRVGMTKNKDDIWTTTVLGDQKGIFYHYRVTINNQINYVVDPYAKALSQNGHKGVIVDLDETNPQGWEQDFRPVLENPEDSIIYEIHVKDFSISPYSDIKNKGKFLAFTEEGTTIPKTDIKTGIDHLKELGITHLHLLPVFDFATVDESVDYQYNWGYDPLNYNAPEGSYATDSADPLCRIKEFKKMVQALHKNGIRVIMDVVYNHTYTVHNSSFGKLAPKEYYRLDYYGNYSNGSGCGNEIASENPMVRKFILDSVLYWAREYHIDGFRFDLMALHDKETMELIADKLHELDSSILIYGEPWMADFSPLPFEKQMQKGRQQDSEIGVFNDDLRDAVKGSTRGGDRGYATGEIDKVHIVKEGIMGAVRTFASAPEEVINYVSAHDDLTLWDKIERSQPNASYEEKVRMNNLSNAIVLSSQGVAFLHGGVEILRTKYGVANSYNASDAINQIDWERKAEAIDVFRYHQGLIRLRKEHPAFRMNSAGQIRKHLKFLKAPYGVICYGLGEYANGDLWKKIVVIHNPHWHKKEVLLPEKGKWNVVVNHKKAGIEVLEVVKGKKVSVPKISTMILYKS